MSQTQAVRRGQIIVVLMSALSLSACGDDKTGSSGADGSEGASETGDGDGDAETGDSMGDGDGDPGDGERVIVLLSACGAIHRDVMMD